MNNKVLKYLVVINVVAFVLFVIIACGGGGGGGGLIPPIGGGGGGGGSGGGGGLNPNQSNINSTAGGGSWIIVSTKNNSINSSQYSLQFSSSNPNILNNQNGPMRNNSFSSRQYMCGFKPSQKQPNQNIYYSLNAPNLGDTRNFTVTNNLNQNQAVSATCRYVNNNPKFAIWVDDDDYPASVNDTQIGQVANRFIADYITLTNNSAYTPLFWIDILFTSKIDPNGSVLGYFWGSEDTQRININPHCFTLNYGSYNEANVTLVHEFVHLISFHASTIGNKHSWIEEGLATYGEDLCNYQSDVRIASIRAFFNIPDDTRLDEPTVPLPIENYGKSFLFVKLLDQRFTNAWRNMINSNLNGINLIENINGTEDFNTTVEIFNSAIILDINGDLNFGFNGIDLNSIDRNNDNSGNDKGVFKFDESDNDGFQNLSLRNMGAFNSIRSYSAFYIYRTSNPFNGIVTFNGPSGINFNKLNTNVAPFNMLPIGYNIDRIDTNDVRFTVIYK